MFGVLALTAAAIFTDAAVYVNVAEQPARLKLDDRALLAEWKPSYQRGAVTAQPGFLIGAIAMIARGHGHCGRSNLPTMRCWQPRLTRPGRERACRASAILNFEIFRRTGKHRIGRDDG
jgi:hypothetical protein